MIIQSSRLPASISVVRYLGKYHDAKRDDTSITEVSRHFLSAIKL